MRNPRKFTNKRARTKRTRNHATPNSGKTKNTQRSGKPNHAIAPFLIFSSYHIANSKTYYCHSAQCEQSARASFIHNTTHTKFTHFDREKAVAFLTKSE
jgi:hypothetical protein